MNTYMNIALPTDEAIKILLKNARTANADNVVSIDGKTGEIVTSQYISQQSDNISTHRGRYDVVVPLEKTQITKAQLIDHIKGCIDISRELGIIGIV